MSGGTGPIRHKRKLHGINDPVYERHYYVQLLAENGDFEKAEERAKALKRDIEEKDQTLMSAYWWTVGYIELARGNFEAAVTNF